MYALCLHICQASNINPPCFALEGNRFKLKRRQLNIIENLKVQFVMYLGSIVVVFLCFIY